MTTIDGGGDKLPSSDGGSTMANKGKASPSKAGGSATVTAKEKMATSDEEEAVMVMAQ